MTLSQADSSDDAIRNFKKRKHEEHKAKKASAKYPEGFGDDHSSERPTKKRLLGSGKGPVKKFSKDGERPAKKFAKGNSKGFPQKDADKNQPQEKTDWKKFKAEKKEQKMKWQLHKANNDSYQLGVKAKHIWEELRKGDCTGSQREELCDSLMALIKGKVKSLIFAHDTVRVVETLMSQGQEKHRSCLFEELKDSIVELSKSKYSKFFVLKVLMYGTKEEKNHIILALKGQVVKLMKHKTASDVVELAYNDYANAKQRSMLVQEFYGPEFRLFHDEGITCLDDALKKHPEKKENIMKDMHKYIQPVIEKGVFTNTMVHTLLRDFLTHCSKEIRAGIIESLREVLTPIIHTRDGARVAMLCLWHGTNKDRKVILKSFRTHYIKIALEKQGYMVLLAAFDCVDDTEFMRKAVLNELMEELPQLISSDSGMKVLRYLVAPRDRTFFPPCIVKVLEEGDGNETSKKDKTLRQAELQNAVRLPILRLLLAHLDHWAVNPNWTLFIGAALNTLSGSETKSIFEQLAKLFAREYIPGSEGHVLDIAYTVKMATYIIKCDKKRSEENKTTFSSILLSTAEAELPSWINCNRGCFLLVNLIETEIEDVVLKVKRIMKPHKEKLSKSEFKGAEILLTKM